MTAVTRPTLSARQGAILRFIRGHIRTHGYAPGVREIGEACDISSTSVVTYNLDRLEALGFIRRAPGRVRAIAVIRMDDRGQDLATK